MATHAPDQRFQSSFGEIAYGSRGEGRDLVLVHGTPANSRIWEGVIERLSSACRVHFLDLPGYGASAKFEGQDVRLRAFAKTLREFVEHTGLGTAHFVGHDFGAAAVLGAHLLENVPAASLIIADGVALNPWGTPYSLHVREHHEVFAGVPDYIHRAMLAAHLETAVSRPLSQETSGALVEPWCGDAGQPAYYRQVAQFDYDYTAKLEPLYPTIDVPTLVLWGEEDNWIDIEFGRRLYRTIPNAQMKTLPDAGHFGMLDCPGLFARHINEWLDTA